MKYILVATLLIFLAAFGIATGAPSAAPNNCIVCHTEITPEITTAFENDIHRQMGLSCVDCHGGRADLDDEESMNPKYGFVGKPQRKDIPQFCGRCHSDPTYMRPFSPSLATDQVEKYWTSHHGKLLKQGDTNVATCNSCHTTHMTQPAKIASSSVYPLNVPATCAKCHADSILMAPYGIPTTQYAQYTDSLNVHGYALLVKRDIGAPACNDCHGNHGANPPGVENVGQICAQCHVLNYDLYRSSPHKEAFDMMGVPECAFCHQKTPDIDSPHINVHTIIRPVAAMIGTGEGALCIQCHADGEEGWKTAAAIAVMQDSLKVHLEEAHTMLDAAERRGVEVSDERWVLDGDVRHATMELRTAIHSFNHETYNVAYEKADTTLNGVLLSGRLALKELGGRRGYFVVITILIVIFMAAIILKIRELEGKQ